MKTNRPTKFAVLLVALLAACGALAWNWPKPTVTMSASVPRDAARQVNLLVVGDWGDDTRAQFSVADGMASFAQRHIDRLDAVLTTGDNFYMSLTGVDDPNWSRLFEQSFDPVRLNVPFYAVLGNHDYSRGQVFRVQLDYAKRNPQSRWKLPGRWYRLELPDEREPLVTVLMLDSNYLFMSEDEWKEQSAWLATEIARPRTSTWFLACAHVPLYSNGGHKDDERLQREWGPLFEQHGVDFYLCGHDHNLQHLRIPGFTPDILVSGGGGANTHTIERTDRGPFSAEMHGFLHARFGETSADVHLLSSRGRPVHAFAATPRRLRSTTQPATTPAVTAPPVPALP